MLGRSLEPFAAYLTEQRPNLDATELTRLKAAIEALEACQQERITSHR